MYAGALIAGRYRLIEPIGAGSMGQVWRGRDERLQRDIAVKVVDLAQATGPVTADRFRREAQSAAQLSHQFIVSTHDGGVDGSVAFLVMELLQGESIAHRLEAGRMTVAQAVVAAFGVAKALAATHASGIVHLDIKPGNVMLLSSGGVKVLDFGISRVVNDVADATAPHETIGTAAYMSPEQASGRRAGPASDIYSLGCLLFAMLASRPPFLGATSVAVAQQQVGALPPSVRQFRPDAPEPLDALVAQMLVKAPAGRPTAEQVIAALAPFLPGASPAPTQVLPPVTPPARTEFLPPQAPARTQVLPPTQGTPLTQVLPPTRPPASAYPSARVSGAYPHARTAVLPPARPQGRWFRRGFRLIVGAMVVLVAVLLLSFGGQKLLGMLPFGKGVAAAPTTTKPAKTTATRTTTRTTAPAMQEPVRPPSLPLPTLPAIQVPSVPLPTLPSGGAVSTAASQAVLNVALAGVQAALDTWTPSTDKATAAKESLTGDWGKAASAIRAGKNASGALADFRAELDGFRDDGAVPIGAYVSLTAALQGVAGAI